MATKKKMLQAAAGNAGGGGLNVEEVFSTYLYEGNGTTQTITNGIDLDGEGGLVWIKWRSGSGISSSSHILTDTERGPYKALLSDQTLAELTDTSWLTNFLSNGFSVGDSGSVNDLNNDYASWTFRKAPKFFDVVTYTGNRVDTNSFQDINHNLGSTPGMIIVKETSSADDWMVYHRSISTDGTVFKLNSTDAAADFGNVIFDVSEVNSTSFRVGNMNNVNANGSTYVAYLFAHNDGDGEFGGEADADIIKCGSYTGNGSTSSGPHIDLGFEPQWILVKSATNTSNWSISDTMRGFHNGNQINLLYPHLSNSEAVVSTTPSQAAPTSTGFQIQSSGTNFNQSGETYIYIAIRRGTKVPESGTEVFDVALGNNTSAPYFNSNFPVDLGIFKRKSPGSNSSVATRLLQGTELAANTTDAEISASLTNFDYMNGFHENAFNDAWVSWMWKRAPNFFDVVAYTGDGVAGRTVSHNLGVAPEMMWVKKRNNVRDWKVYHSAVGNGIALELNATGTGADSPAFWNDTTPAEGSFTVGSSDTVNGSSDTFIAYLFASLPGVSKVGSYTGNSTGNASGITQTIDCGFTSGARFVLIKKTNGTGSWVVFDTERGIVSGNDPYLELNETAAESTVTDAIDPHSSGFTLTSSTLFNSNGDSYIFYAIA